MIISLFIFVSCNVNEILIKGFNKNIWYLSLKTYICILISVSSNLLVNTHFIIYILPLTIAITTFLLFIIFLILNHYGIFFIFNSKASIFTSLSSPLTYLGILFICSLNFLLDYSERLSKLFIRKSLSNKLILKDYFNNKRKKSYSSNSKLNSSKQNSKHSKDKNKNNISYDERSRSHLISKSTSKIKRLNQSNKRSVFSYFPKNYINPRFRIGDSNIQSLKILKNINNRSVNFPNNNDKFNNNSYDLQDNND